ncbi:MAG: plastocyanin/azurin family copper-binding protein [Verrucomicrobiota bacterium]
MKIRFPISLCAAALATTAFFSSVASAADARVVEITANDQMKFSLATIEAKPGEQLKVVFKNVGTLPKQAMGHNWVLLKKGSDVMAFGGAAAGAAATEYIPAGQKDKIVAHSKLLGPKETSEVAFTVPSEAGDYPFLCSFPGHFALMKGMLTVK